jgi:hypothetical protein
MKKNSAGYTMLTLILVVAFIVGVGVFYYMRSSNSDDALLKKQAELKAQLANAKSKLANEKDKLNDAEKAFRVAFPFYDFVDDQLIAMSQAVSRTDVLFQNPQTDNPVLKVKTSNPEVQKNIEEKRVVINQILSDWRSRVDVALAGKIDKSTLDQLKKDSITIQTYVNDLNAYVDSLTPANSGLTQTQIQSYEQMIDSVLQEIKDVINAIDTTGQNIQNPDPTVQQNTQPPTSQQTAVNTAQAQVTFIEQQLADVQAQIDANNNQNNTLPQDQTSGEQTQSPTTDTSQDNSNATDTGSTIFFPTQPINVTPGAPRLIQGTNKD